MNYRVIAQSGLKIRSGPGVEYGEEGVLANGEILISPDISDWLPILVEDEDGVDSVAWVKREFVKEAPEDIRQIEAAETQIVQSGNLPIMQKDLVKLFGYPKERAGYLTTIDLREFAQHLGHVKDFQGNQWSCRIYGHELLEIPLKRAFAALCDGGLAGELKTYDGCFNIRKMTGGSSYSVHSWGLAVDFNAAQNPYGGEVSFSDDLILCFAEAGFESGALWNTPDGMHLQICWTRDWRQSDEPLRPR